ncbi:MAG: carbamoyltransferase [Candidatus Peregrinibacteria bacterium]
MAKPIYILGISCFYHDSAVVLLKDNEVLFAAQEERYTRNKHDDAFPENAVREALKFAGISSSDLSAVAFYEKPLLKFFDRILQTSIKVWPRGFRQFHMIMQEWMTTKLWTPQLIRRELDYSGPVFFVPHHASHAASAYFASGFPDATVVTVDGVGEWATTTIASARGNECKILKEIHFPHSLGLLYSALTYYLGFRVNSAEYKVMGLAPYGEPKYMEQMHRLIDLKEDGSFALNMEYFTYEYGLTMTGKTIEELLGQPRRTPESPLTQFHKDIARSLQELTEEVMLKIVAHAKKIAPSKFLCLAGGVALNCVANGKILRSGLFEDIFIQPAAGDAGGALGAALTVWHQHFHGERLKRMENVFLGNEYSNDAIRTVLDAKHLPYEHLSGEALIEKISLLLEGENVIGWYQGRMEYGPRSLGNRSIIADARNRENWQKVNLKIKFRESFRPFAPTVLEERAKDYFKLDRESPYMLLVADVHPDKREGIPAVTHVDGSARIQTINRSQNAKYYDLIKAFEKRTGCPVIINTSFNVRGEPIVESPENAINCFLHTHMDYLVLGNCLLSKSAMPETVKRDSEEYLKKFALD